MPACIHRFMLADLKQLWGKELEKKSWGYEKRGCAALLGK